MRKSASAQTDPHTNMPIISAFLPGGLGMTIVGTVLCFLSFGFTLAVNPDYLVALFVVYAGSTSGYLPTLFILIGERRERLNPSEGESPLPSILRIAKVQLAVTLVQVFIWISAVIITILNFIHELQDPLRLVCPSNRCILFGIASSLTYLHFLIVTIQLLLLVFVVAEVQRAPRRIVGNRSLRVLLEKEIDTLLLLRSEAQQARTSGGPTREDQSRAELGEVATIVIRPEGRDVGFVVNDPNASRRGLTESRTSAEDEAWPRRRRTPSAQRLAASNRPPQTNRLSLTEVETTVTSRRSSGIFPPADLPSGGDTNLELSRIRTRSDLTDSDIVIYQGPDQLDNPTFASPADSYISKLHAQDVPESPYSDVLLTRPASSSQGATASIARDMLTSPESRYSRVSYLSTNVEGTPPHLSGIDTVDEASPAISDKDWVLRTPRG
ncbi:hypothetical protein BCR39DRAFT_545777 [Naematelia encephala]|uniref:Uncharacterized protein n=1 Tax=Naematelia encephala TaxID=71784 RepID=A0A1Y2AQK2_9TREE|nr:hypothetical protein BCR39DRAFT_545777 [Naematelia encephala]